MSGIAPSKHLAYAEGYLALGLLDPAREEIAAAEALVGRTLPVLQLRLELEFAAQHWETVLNLAPVVIERDAANERAYIAWAYSARELQRVELAREILLRAEPHLGPSCALLHYNLACYECLLGNHEVARQRLEQALALDSRLAEGMKDDPDLRSLAPK